MKKLTALLLALCLLGSLTPLMAEDTRIFVDDAGREVVLKKDITRIVVSGPLAQIAVFAIAPEMLAGLSSPWDEPARPYVDDAYLNLPVVGQLYGGKGEVNLEELARLAPDVLIDLGEAKATVREDLDALQEQTGVPCVHIGATLPTYGHAYRRLGELLNKPEAAEALAAYCDDLYARALAITEQVGEERAQVVYAVGEDGLSVLAKGSFHADVVDLLADNRAVVEDVSSRGLGNPVDMEQMLLWDPDILIFAHDTVYDTVAEDETWSTLAAVRNGRYIEVPLGPYNWMGSPPSVQRYLALLWLPKVLYPELAEYDLYEEVSKYFELFYHKALSRADFDALIENAVFK